MSFESPLWCAGCADLTQLAAFTEPASDPARAECTAPAEANDDPPRDGDQLRDGIAGFQKLYPGKVRQ